LDVDEGTGKFRIVEAGKEWYLDSNGVSEGITLQTSGFHLPRILRMQADRKQTSLPALAANVHL
jgi:hypothetical protein